MCDTMKEEGKTRTHAHPSPDPALCRLCAWFYNWMARTQKEVVVAEAAVEEEEEEGASP